MKQTISRQLNYLNNKELASILQPLAIQKFYSRLWPNSSILELDIDIKSKLAHLIDVGGADKMLRFHNGSIAFLAQRFRDWEHRKRDDFTIRSSELNKVIDALAQSGFIASYYAYGYSNFNRTDFIKVRIFRYREALEYLLGNDLLKYWRANKDGTRFFYVPFSAFPDNLFLFNEKREKQLSL